MDHFNLDRNDAEDLVDFVIFKIVTNKDINPADILFEELELDESYLKYFGL